MATSLIRPNIFGPWVTTVDRFLCSVRMRTDCYDKPGVFCIHTESYIRKALASYRYLNYCCLYFAVVALNIHMEVLVEVQQQIKKLRTCLDQEKYPASSLEFTTLETLLEQLIQELGDNEAVQNAQLQDYCQELVSTLFELKETTNKLVSLLNNTDAEKQELRQDISRLEKKVVCLEKKVKLLEEMEQNLLLGQLAFVVDRALLDKVLKDSGCRPANELHIYSIQDMEKAIDGKQHYIGVFEETERMSVKEHWKQLQNTLAWEGKHYRCLRYLKSTRLAEAHPEFDCGKMKDAIQKQADKEMKGVCLELLTMVEIVKKLR